jgi:hypothetical protein
MLLQFVITPVPWFGVPMDALAAPHASMAAGRPAAQRMAQADRSGPATPTDSIRGRPLDV